MYMWIKILLLSVLNAITKLQIKSKITMKKNLFLLSALLFCILHVSAQNKTHVTIIDNGGVNEQKISVVLYNMRHYYTALNDTLEFKSNKIDIDVNLDYLGNMNLRSLNKANNFNEFFYIVPGTSLTVNCYPDSTIFSGAQIYSDMNKIKAVERPYLKKYHELDNTIKNGGDKKDSLAWALHPKMDKIIAEMDKADLKFLKENPNNLAIPIIGSVYKDYNNAEKLVSDTVKKGPFSVIYKNNIEYSKFLYDRRLNKANVKEGNEAIDFTLKNPEGKDVSLSSLRGKYVVIDFWNSSCGPCIMGFPKMKAIYEKYKPTGKFEIIGVFGFTSEQNWRRALKKYELPWIQVYNPKDSKVEDNYNVTGYPTKVVISPNGKILKWSEAETDWFYGYIDWLMKSKGI